MAAANAVFDTVELLEAIILCAPAPAIPRLELVSPHWKAVNRRSSRIRIYYESRLISPEVSDTDIPIYAKNSNLGVYWEIAYCKSLLRSPDPPYAAVQPFTIECHANVDILDPYWWPDSHECEEFATDPACQALRVCKSDWKEGQQLIRHVYREEGVKIKHLVGILREFQGPQPIEGFRVVFREIATEKKVKKLASGIDCG